MPVGGDPGAGRRHTDVDEHARQPYLGRGLGSRLAFRGCGRAGCRRAGPRLVCVGCLQGAATGVLVVVNGVFGNNTHQALDPEEFRGFVLCDRLAPLIFINGADFKSAQMFTLAHELAHLWVGKDGVFNLPDLQASEDEIEKFCNRVAAEVLIPSRELEACWPQVKAGDEPYNALARRFKVSEIVAARRVLDHGLISREMFYTFLNAYRADERRKAAQKPLGGHFYRTQDVRIGHRFGSAVIRAARSVW